MRRITVSLLLLSLLSSSTLAQNSERTVTSDAGLAAAQRRDFAISIVISLTKETNSFSDLALRPRVLARAADVLWEADNSNARSLFIDAWQAAEKGDAEEVTIKTKDNPPPMVISLRRLGGYDLRSEVLGFIARRDRKLTDTFLAKFISETEQQANNSSNTRLDNWSASEADTKRLEVARQLLKQGLVQEALEVALTALTDVNAKSIAFLSELRTRNAEAADRRFSFLLSLSALDPFADANTVSGLSSYVFTPGLYITFNAEGGATWSQEQRMQPPDLSANLRHKFLKIAANLLLRRLPPPDSDSSSSGRVGTINVIRRLLPFFEKYLPDTAVALRGYLIQLTGNSAGDVRAKDNPLLTRGIREEEPGDVLKGLQDRIDRAKTSRQRDLIYTEAAATLATHGEVQARELAAKIDDSERKTQVRQFIDFQFVQLAIKKKNASEAVRLVETGQLTHTQRAFGYTQAARLLTDSQPLQSLELLDKATDEAMRIEHGAVDRAVLLVGIATQLIAIDRTRCWEVMNRLAEAANASEDFTGENWIYLSMPSTSGIKSLGIGGEGFSLSGVFQLLAKDDLYRAIDLMKSFKHDAARAASTLAIANAILAKQDG